eukprot:g28007.t1
MRCCSSSLRVVSFVALEEAQDGHAIQGVGGGVKMVDNWKVMLFVTYRTQMLYETVSNSMHGLTDVAEGTLGAADIVDQVGGCRGEPLSGMKDLFWALDEGEGGSRLELVEVAANDPLDVDAGEMVGDDKGGPCCCGREEKGVMTKVQPM